MFADSRTKRHHRSGRIEQWESFCCRDRKALMNEHEYRGCHSEWSRHVLFKLAYLVRIPSSLLCWSFNKRAFSCPRSSSPPRKVPDMMTLYIKSLTEEKNEWMEKFNVMKRQFDVAMANVKMIILHIFLNGNCLTPTFFRAKVILKEWKPLRRNSLQHE